MFFEKWVDKTIFLQYNIYEAKLNMGLFPLKENPTVEVGTIERGEPYRRSGNY